MTQPDLARLGDHIDLLTGFAFDSKLYSEGDGIRLLRGDNITPGKLRWTDAKRLPGRVTPDLERFRLAAGDIVVALDRPWVAGGLKVATVSSSDLPSLLVQRVARVRAKERLDQGYLRALLAGEPLLRVVRASQTETAVPHISPNDLREMRVPLPALSEQRRIASVLGAWDDALEALDRLISAKECRLLNLKAILFRPAPDDDNMNFGDFLTESRDVGSNGSNARKLSVKLYGRGVVAKADRTLGSENTVYFRRRAGQLIYSKLDFLNGAFGIIPTGLDGYESTLDLPAFDVSPRVNARWLVEYLTRPIYYENQTDLARGQRIARRVNPPDFLAAPIELPSKEHQDHVVEIIDLARADLLSTTTEREALQRQKRGLMQKLLTGEWRAPTSNAEVAA